MGGLVVATCFCLPALAATVEIVPDARSVQPGDTITVDIRVGDLGDGAAPSLGAFDIELGYDPGLLTYSDALLVAQLGDPDAGESIESLTPGTGLVHAWAVSLLPAVTLNSSQPATFSILTLELQAAAAGAGDLTISVNALGDENGAPLAFEPVTPVSITVNAQDPTDPEPDPEPNPDPEPDPGPDPEPDPAPPPAPPPVTPQAAATPIPSMSTLGYAGMILALFLFASRRLRGNKS